MVSPSSSTPWGSGTLVLGTQTGKVWPETSTHDNSDFHHLKAREGKLKKDFHRRDYDKGAFRMLVEGR